MAGMLFGVNKHDLDIILLLLSSLEQLPYSLFCVCVSLSSYVYHLCIDKDEADNAITLCNIFTNSKNNN